MSRLTTGEVAKRAGVKVETVRFYERKGLIPEPERSASGYRLYKADTVRRLRFIQRAKDVGFTLRDIGELLSLRTRPGVSCADIRSRALTKIEDIDQKIRDLERMRNSLMSLAQECSAEGPLSECPILDSLERDEESANAQGGTRL